MTHERELEHAVHAPTSKPEQSDIAPGQVNRTAALNAPSQPVVSGILSRKQRDANGVAVGAGDAVTAASSSSGSPLPASLMRKFESALGADLSGVRVHTGETSVAAADAVGAKAYTLGQDIHFGAGHFDPSSAAGEHLLAHEVAHTVQQAGSARRMQYKLEVSSPGDAHEHEADRAADAMVAGQIARVTGSSGIARDFDANAKVDKKGASITVDISPPEKWMDKASKNVLRYFTLAPTVGGSVTATWKVPGSEGKKTEDEGANVSVSGGTKPKISGDVENKDTGSSAGADLDSKGLKLHAEQKLGDGVFAPKFEPELSWDKEGPHFSVGLTWDVPGVDIKGIKVHDIKIHALNFDFKKSLPEITLAAIDAQIEFPAVHWGNWELVFTLKCGGKISPDWEAIAYELGRDAAESLAADVAVTVGAIAAPLAAAAGLLVTASHEMDKWNPMHAAIQGLRSECEYAAYMAVGGSAPSIVTMFPGANKMAGDIRKSLADATKMPEAAIAKIMQANPTKAQLLASCGAEKAWFDRWPVLKAQLAAQGAFDGDYRSRFALLDAMYTQSEKGSYSAKDVYGSAK